MLDTPFTKLTGCSVPIQLAGMPKVCTPELVAAVAKAGGLGMLSGALVPAPILADTLEQAVTQGGNKIGVNFLMPHLKDRETVRLAAERSRLVDSIQPAAEIVSELSLGAESLLRAGN